MFAYIGLIIHSLKSLSFWNDSLLKETIFWIFGVALIMLFKANKAMKEKHFFGNYIISNVKLIALIQYLVYLKSFSLIVELITTPIIAIISASLAYSETDKKYSPATKLFKFLVTIYGIVVLILSIIYIFDNYHTFNYGQQFSELFIVPLLTIFFIPFAYIFSIYMAYESYFRTIYVRLRPDKKLIRKTRIEVFLVCKLSINRLRFVSENLKLFMYNNELELMTGMEDIRKKLIPRYTLMRLAKDIALIGFGSIITTLYFKWDDFVTKTNQQVANKSSVDTIKVNTSIYALNKNDSLKIDTVDIWKFKSIENQNIIFENGKKIETNLRELNYISSLYDENKTPFLILSGKECDSCDANISIFIKSPIDSLIENKYSYPGKIYYWEDNSLISETRMFIGECLTNQKNMIIWYQKELNDENKWIESAYTVRIIDGKLVGRFEPVIPDIKETLKLLKAKKCFEVDRLNQTSEP
ncbi:MAG: hypothetical protein KDD94_05315 [Calditrichaeota bacterium]|nr:hypothetical protein [Calditrichota bacterium]